MFRIRTLNNIALAGLERFPRDRYEVASEIIHPDAILVRSHPMHDLELPDTLKAIGRAGAGVNNIPVEAMSERGIVVFNAPGANANAVKELVVAAMLLASRNICQGWAFAKALTGDDADIHRQVEAGKKRFAGTELPGRTLGVVGLGAIGVLVANAARALGMRVIGYDPQITVRSAWKLSADVEHATSIDDLMARSDFVSCHVPLLDATRSLINADRLRVMKSDAVILNFARNGIVDDAAVCNALDEGRLRSYICDFPSAQLNAHPKVIVTPHLGASTAEAESNSATMVADQIREYLEDGNIRNSVNFPEVSMPRNDGYRMSIVNANVPNMLGQISTCLADAGLNIIDMLNKSRGDLAYTLVDVELAIPDAVMECISDIEGVLAVRTLDPNRDEDLLNG